MASNKGGKRPGAGRPFGSTNKTANTFNSLIVKNLLEENKEIIMNTAIRLATAKEPNTSVLLKLLDKISPSLTSSSGELNVNNNSPVGKLDDDQLKSLVTNLLKVVSKRDELINTDDTKNKKS